MCGSFAGGNTEVFDHGTLTTTSQTNAFVCSVYDLGSTVQFKTTGPGSGNEGATEGFSAPMGLSQDNLGQLAFYPNPTGGQLSIELGEGLAPVKVEVLNYQGRRLRCLEVNASMAHYDLSALSPGVYLLHWTLNGRGHSQKLVIE